MSFKYWAYTEEETILFNTDVCEECGCRVMTPNSVHGVRSDIIKYERLGITEWEEHLPPEDEYCDELEKTTCSDCAQLARANTPVRRSWKAVVRRLVTEEAEVIVAADGMTMEQAEDAAISAAKHTTLDWVRVEESDYQVKDLKPE